MLDNTKNFQFDLKKSRKPDKNMLNIVHMLKII